MEDDKCDDAEEVQPKISYQRRKELMAFAAQLADQIREKVKPHELCLIRRFAEGLLDREEY